jgi:hypothetical protein
MLGRIARVIRDYDAQGDHRTGTDPDHRSARWLARIVEETGRRASLEPFRLSRVDPQWCYLQTAERLVGGLPMFDGSFTNERGLVGRLGNAGDETDFGLVVADQVAISAEAEAIKDLRRSNTHKGFIIVTRGGRPGLCPIILATSGHELGHLGLEEFLARRPSLGKQAFAWLLFGANIGAAHGKQRMTRLQASDDEIERTAEEAMEQAGTRVDGKLPRGTVPGGEVRNIHERGGRYVRWVAPIPTSTTRATGGRRRWTS